MRPESRQLPTSCSTRYRPLIDVLALDFEARTLEVKGVPEVRVLIATGVLVAHLALYAVLAEDDSAEIIYLEIDDEL